MSRLLNELSLSINISFACLSCTEENGENFITKASKALVKKISFLLDSDFNGGGGEKNAHLSRFRRYRIQVSKTRTSGF